MTSLDDAMNHALPFLPFELLSTHTKDPPLHASALSLFVVWASFTSFYITTFILYWKRKDVHPIKSKMPLLSAVSAFFGYLTVTVHAFEAFYTGSFRWPCWLRSWTLWFIVPCTFLAYPFRAFRFLMVARNASFMASMQDRQEEFEQIVELPTRYSNPMNTKKNDKEEEENKTIATATATATITPTASIVQMAPSCCFVCTACCTPAQYSTKAHIATIRGHIRRIHAYAAATVGCFAVITVIMQIGDGPQQAAYGCQAPSLFTTIGHSIAFGLLLVIESMFVVWMVVQNMSDTFSINYELKFLLMAKIMFVVPYMVFEHFIHRQCSTETYSNQSLPTATPLTTQELILDTHDHTCVWIHLSYWFVSGWVVSAYAISIVWPLWQSLTHGERALRKEHEQKLSKFAKRRRTSQMLLSLNKLLAYKNGRDSFFNFLKGEYSMENLLFYEACTKYNKWIPTCQDDVQKYMAAKEIYLKYIQPNKAPFEINLPTQITKPLIELFEQKEDETGKRWLCFVFFTQVGLS